jgi:hypothetical protein
MASGRAALVCLASLASCRRDAVVTTRTITAYVPQACAVTGQGYATYSPLGDFEPSAPAPGPYLSSIGTPLPWVDSRVRELVMTASANTSSWEGLTPVAAQGDIAVLVLPELLSCPLSNGVGARSGSTLAPIGSGNAMLVGGVGDSVPLTYVVHLDTGAVVPTSPDLQTPRNDASVTAFGAGALVAGGGPVVPPDAGGDPDADDTAEVYSSLLGGFDGARRIQLSEPRAHHGAAVLPSGRTLLVGGSSDALGTRTIGRLEIVDPSTRLASEEGLTFLIHPRIDPVVLRLTSGNVLVGGGLSDGGDPVPWMEWFSPDGTTSPVRPFQLTPGSASTFTALDGGGVLVVVAPPPEAPPDFQTTWIFDSSGAYSNGPPIGVPLPHPVFFGGAGGAPILWTGDGWLRYQPWTGAFVALPVLDGAPANIGAAACSPDSGLALWLDENEQHVAGLRFDTRNAYSSLSGSLLAQDPFAAQPGVGDVAPDGLPSSAMTFDPATGLALPMGAGAFVTDRTYADVSITMATPTGQPAIVVLADGLGNELDVGGASCPGLLTVGASAKVSVVRAGGTVTWAVDDGTASSCPPPPWDPAARVSIAVRGAPLLAPSSVENVTVTRTDAP